MWELISITCSSSLAPHTFHARAFDLGTNMELSFVLSFLAFFLITVTFQPSSQVEQERFNFAVMEGGTQPCTNHYPYQNITFSMSSGVRLHLVTKRKYTI
jgi:hypothetical protein